MVAVTVTATVVVEVDAAVVVARAGLLVVGFEVIAALLQAETTRTNIPAAALASMIRFRCVAVVACTMISESCEPSSAKLSQVPANNGG